MVEPGWRFCGDCGAPATQTKATHDEPPDPTPEDADCPYCGASVARTAAYCGACGADLLGVATAQSVSADAANDAGRASAAPPSDLTGPSQRRRWPAVMALVLAGLTVGAVALVATGGVPWSGSADQTTDDDALAAEVTEATATPTTGPQPTPASPAAPATPEDTPDTTPTPRPDGPPTPVAIPAGFTSCGTGTDGVRVFANEVTSCPFALNVADAWTQPGDSPVLFDVPSPVTGQTYDMRCSATDPVRCTGGNNAAVLIYP